MKYNNSVEYMDAINQLVKRNMDIISLAKSENRELTEEEEKEFDENQEEVKELTDEKDELQKSLDEPQEEEDKEEKSKTNTKISRDYKMKNSNYSLIEEIRNSVKTGEQIVLDRAYTVQSEGEDLVQTDVYNILEPLRAKLALVNAGAHFMSNLKGDVQLAMLHGLVKPQMHLMQQVHSQI